MYIIGLFFNFGRLKTGIFARFFKLYKKNWQKKYEGQTLFFFKFLFF